MWSRIKNLFPLYLYSLFLSYISAATHSCDQCREPSPAYSPTSNRTEIAKQNIHIESRAFTLTLTAGSSRLPVLYLLLLLYDIHRNIVLFFYSVASHNMRQNVSPTHSFCVPQCKLNGRLSWAPRASYLIALGKYKSNCSIFNRYMFKLSRLAVLQPGRDLLFFLFFFSLLCMIYVYFTRCPFRSNDIHSPIWAEYDYEYNLTVLLFA